MNPGVPAGTTPVDPLSELSNIGLEWYTAISGKPATPAATPLVYSSPSPSGGTAVGIDLSQPLVLAGIFIALWLLLHK